VTARRAPRLLPAPVLHALLRDVFAAVGAPADVAEEVAGSLVASNVRGVDSHGAMRLPEYVGYVRDGLIDPTARPAVSVTGAVVQVAGRRAFGQLAARAATLAAVDRAREHAIALGVVSEVKHVGRVGEFVEACAAQGLVGLAFCNGGPPGGLVAPFGGRGRALGTNPLAYAFPVEGRPPVVADFSTSAVAEGKVRVYAEEGLSLPPGWIVDADGRPSRDPADLYSGGAILPAGGHKGFALGLLVEVLGGVLAGEGCASAGDDPGNGVVLVVVDPGEAFPAGAARAVAALEAAEPADGFERVQVPGAPELATMAVREAEGVPIPAVTWSALVAAARSVGVEPPQLADD
jgi:LDH2 family malate/lactate/ureidoglycolate dehydrogenase